MLDLETWDVVCPKEPDSALYEIVQTHRYRKYTIYFANIKPLTATESMQPTENNSDITEAVIAPIGDTPMSRLSAHTRSHRDRCSLNSVDHRCDRRSQAIHTHRHRNTDRDHALSAHR